MHENITEFFNADFIRSDEVKPYGFDILDSYLRLNPIAYFIPTNFGGKFNCAESYLSLVEETSYHSVSFGLTIGISGSLFIQPIAKYASESIQNKLIPLFLTNYHLGGMMMTEPNGGTDIFNMKATYYKSSQGLVLEGIKCWAGLTGQAKHWLVAAREKKENRITKKINLVYVPQEYPGVKTTKIFEAIGLYPIGYGETSFNVTLPMDNLLENSNSTGLRIIYDTLFRSRMGISAIAAGMCKRLFEETQEWTKNRIVFGKSLITYDQVQYRSSSLKGYYQICHSIWKFCAQHMNKNIDVSRDITLTMASKTIASDIMNLSSNCAMQLLGAAGYKKNHFVGQAYLDSRAFPIFEGTNDVLYEKIFDALKKAHGRVSLETLKAELKNYGLFLDKGFPVNWMEDLPPTENCTQRKKVHIGQLIAWAFIVGILGSIFGRKNPACSDGLRVALKEAHSLAASLPFLH